MHVLALAFLLALGDGKAIFEGKGGCVNCHSIENKGGSVGPDLTEIGIRRTPESLRLALVDPDAEIFEEYLSKARVLFKDFKKFATGLTAEVCQNAEQLARALGRPFL